MEKGSQISGAELEVGGTMSWVTLISSVGVGVCLTLTLFHIVVWRKDRTALVNLLFSDGNCRAGLSGAQIGDDATRNTGALRHRDTLDSRSSSGHR